MCTHHKILRPLIQLLFDLTPLLLAHCSWRAVQLRVPLPTRRLLGICSCNRAIEHRTPYWHRLRECIGHTLARACRVDKDESPRGGCGGVRVRVWGRVDKREEMEVGPTEVEAPVTEVTVGRLEVRLLWSRLCGMTE